MSTRAATVRARRGARPSNGASPVEAAITFRLGAVRASFWPQYLDDHIAELEARHAICGISSWRTRHEVRALPAHGTRARHGPVH